MPDRKLRVFLCHASQDKPIVRELYQRLLAEGWIDPWLDEEKLLPGQDWDMEIEKAVETSDAVIVCLSNNSVSKEGYIQKELRKILNVAQEKPEGSIFVIPLRLMDCQVPRGVSEWQFVDYFPIDHREWAYDRLLSSLDVKAKFVGNIVPFEFRYESKLTRFRDLVQSGITLNGKLDEEDVLHEIARTAKKVLNSQFIVVSTIDMQGEIKKAVFEGEAPKLVKYLTQTPGGDKLFQAIISSNQAVRVLDVHKLDPEIMLDSTDLQSFIAVPLLLHKLAIGSILGFGIDQKPSFNEEDEVLAMMLGMQACTAIESVWLYKELRTNLGNAVYLNNLSTDLIQVTELQQALIEVLRAAIKLSNASSAGIVLYSKNNEIEFAIDDNGNQLSAGTVLDFAQRVYDSDKQLNYAPDQETIMLGFILQTQFRKYGALWVNIPVAASSSLEFVSLQVAVTLAVQTVERLVLVKEYKN